MEVVRRFEPTFSNVGGSNVGVGGGVVSQPAYPGERVVYGPETFEPSGGAPSRRANKNRSGRAGRKAYNGRKWVQAVGGTSDMARAMYAPADKELCKVVPGDTGYRNGKPFRSPR